MPGVIPGQSTPLGTLPSGTASTEPTVSSQETVTGGQLSPTSVCNDALLLLSGAQESQVIEDIEDTGDPVAKKCLLVYPRLRDDLVMEIQPHYSMKYGDCGTQPDDDVDIADWLYHFNLPHDCLQNVVAYQTDANNRQARYRCWVQGGQVFTNSLSNAAYDSAYLYYLWRLTDVNQMSEAFRWALACGMAQRLSGPIDPKRMEYLRQLANDARDAAILADSWRCRQEEEGSYSWLDARIN